MPLIPKNFKHIFIIHSTISSFISIVFILINGANVSIVFWCTNSSLESSHICCKLFIITLDWLFDISELVIIFCRTTNDDIYILLTLFSAINKIGSINLSIDDLIFSSNLSKEDSFSSDKIFKPSSSPAFTCSCFGLHSLNNF